MSREDDWGQVDGDESGPAEFKPASAGQPWLRDAIPPWHLWGNTQRITVPFDSNFYRFTAGQLVKISYKRPETWHWLFGARLISGPNSDGINPLLVSVAFELTVGIGRSMLQISEGVTSAHARNQSFENYNFQWGPSAVNFPVNALLYSSEVLAPNRQWRSDPPFPNEEGFPTPGPFVTGPSHMNQIVAQDIQLNCRVQAFAIAFDPNLGQPVTVEVTAQFAPKTHMRPDWLRNGPEEVMYAGSEVEGR